MHSFVSAAPALPVGGASLQWPFAHLAYSVDPASAMNLLFASQNWSLTLILMCTAASAAPFTIGFDGGSLVVATSRGAFAWRG